MSPNERISIIHCQICNQVGHDGRWAKDFQELLKKMPSLIADPETNFVIITDICPSCEREGRQKSTSKAALLFSPGPQSVLSVPNR